MQEKKIYIEEYKDNGLNDPGKDPKQMYLDLMKRVLVNIIYEDSPLLFYDHTKKPIFAEAFSLKRRLWGEDVPTKAHTMIGFKRLENIQYCIEQVLNDNIGGDLVETGTGRGGSAIFMRAVLKAHTVFDRKVVACDVFAATKGKKINPLLLSAVNFFLSISNKEKRKEILVKMQNSQDKNERSFPIMNNPSDEWTDLVHFTLKNNNKFAESFPENSLENVRSHFARYGLLDEQILFLKGFFDETLPRAPIDKIAVLRLDGDTYESTRDVLKLLYEKLSPGGYCIIDDYNAFSDCKKAVDEFRTEQNITAELKPIDRIGCYWKKTIKN